MIPEVPLSRRSGITEVEMRFSAEEAQVQAERCLYCHIHPIYDGSKCILCNRCVDICPEHCLHFTLADTTEGLRAARRECRIGGAGQRVSLRRREVHPLRAVRDSMPHLGDHDGTHAV